MSMLLRELLNGLIWSTKLSSAILSFLMLISLFSGTAGAAPREVTFYLQAARVTEQTKVRLLPEGKELRKAIVIVPQTTDISSFVVYSPTEIKLKLVDLTWRKLPRDEEPGIKEARRQIKQLREERNGLQATLHGLDNQIQFWQQQTKSRAKTTAEAGVFAAAIGKNIKKAFQDKLNLAPEIPRLDNKIRYMEEELSQTRGKDDKLWQWEVSILFSGGTVGVPINDLLLTYSYTLTGCGWQPAYRFESRPLQAEVIFGQEAEIWQNSGQQWNDVAIQLTSLTAPASFQEPSGLPAWTIRPREASKAKAKRPAEKVKALSRPDEGKEAVAVITPDDLKLWQIGKKTVLTGSHLKVKIYGEVWPASFSYLSRPAQNPQALFGAFFKFSETRKMPPGQALFFSQDALVGKSNFSLLSEKQGTIYFGPDPQVTVTRKLLIDQPQHQQWRLEARNDHTAAIKLNVEESVPQANDSKIKVRLSAPGADRNSGLLRWQLELAAGEMKALTYDIEIDFPMDMEIESGFTQ